MDAEAVLAMLGKDRAEWEALVAALDAHPDESLHDSSSPPWTSRDVYAHLARWIEHSTAALEAHLAGRTLPPIEGTDDEINARWREEDSRLSFDEARGRAWKAFEQRLRAIGAVPIERWDKTLDEIVCLDGAGHYASHRNSIVVA